MSITARELRFDPAIAMARQALYRFAALTLLDPEFGSWEKLVVLRDDAVLYEAAALLGDLSEAIPDQLAPGERSLAELNVSAVMAGLHDTRDEFNRHFETTFGLLVSNACPPYETEYINGKFTFQRGHALADISGFYQAFGIATSESHPERPDHIVQELEFMAFLIGLTRQADQSGSSLRADRMRVCCEPIECEFAATRRNVSCGTISPGGRPHFRPYSAEKTLAVFTKLQHDSCRRSSPPNARSIRFLQSRVSPLRARWNSRMNAKVAS